MKKYFALLFPILLASQLLSQSYHPIQVVDAHTNDPLAYARIYNMKTGRGLITNEDGVFRYAFKDSITRKPFIRVSYVGYQTAYFTPVAMSSMTEIRLKTNTYSLAEVVVRPKSWAIDFMHQVVENHVSQPEKFHNYKTYLIANSTIDDKPVELIQAYYNGMFNPFTVDNLRFKSGRIAHAPYNNTYFLNLNPGDLFSKFHPFNNHNSSFPSSFTANIKIKNLLYYDVELVKEVCSGHDTLLYFSCSSKVEWLMDCAAVVRKSDKMFQSLTYQTQIIPPGIFQPINEDDEILSGSLAITVDFHPERNTIHSMDLQYDIDYLFGNGQKSRIKYDSKLLAMEGAFTQVPNIRSEYKLNTYDLTFALNYCESLWENNGVILSNRQKQSLAYFRTHGHSINYGDSVKSVFAPYSSLWRWSNNPVQISDLNSKELFNYEPGESAVQTTFVSDLLRFDFRIVLTIFDDGDSIFWNTSTVLNRKESYCFYKASAFYEKYLNLSFDTHEVFRRKFESKLAGFTSNEYVSHEIILKEFDHTLSEMNHKLEYFEKQLSINQKMAIKLWSTWVSTQLESLEFEPKSSALCN